MKKKGQKPHATQSFEQLVSIANREALKPFIVETIASIVEQRVQQAEQTISRYIIDALAGVQTRLMVLERIVIAKLDETPDSLSEKILEVEDEATGHAKATDAATVGDLLRTTLKVRTPDTDKFSSPTPVIIRRLAVQDPGQPFQTYPELERGLLGALPGETREVRVPVIVQGSDATEYIFAATVDRISRVKNAVEVQSVQN